MENADDLRILLTSSLGDDIVILDFSCASERRKECKRIG